ncbi:hypothetical protein [Halorussus salinus]|uniref:hypothetical protein n=1 Tax=Halorussus salinus TaxID=1364935 RepID=UPI001092AE97|nr:hypothetical protein [Halorussus salinus]
MPADLNRTHHLESEGFAEEFGALVESVFPETTTAVVELREDEMEMDPDGDECRRVWESVAPEFERVARDSGESADGETTASDAANRGDVTNRSDAASGGDGADSSAWRCRTTTEEGRAALRELVALTDGIAGAHFVFRIELRDGETPVLDAIPHHSDAGLDATRLAGVEFRDEGESGSGIKPGEVVGLDGHAACLVPAEPQVEWTAEDRAWRLAGGSLCAERDDGRATSCYGVTNLRGVELAEDGSWLALQWKTGELPDDPIGNALSWLANKLYNPPSAIPCGTAARAREVRRNLQETLAAYDGREL